MLLVLVESEENHAHSRRISCEGIAGKISSLGQANDFTNEAVSVPVDTLVVDLNRDGDEGSEWGMVVNM